MGDVGAVVFLLLAGVDQAPVGTVGQLCIRGGESGLAFLFVGDAKGREHLALAGVEGVHAAVRLGVTGHFIGDLGTDVLKADSALAQHIGGVAGAGDHIAVRRRGALAKVGGDLRLVDLAVSSAGGLDLERPLIGGGGGEIAILGGHPVIHHNNLAIPGVEGEVTGHTVLVGVLEGGEQVEVFQVGGGDRVHEHKRKLLLAVTAGLGGGAVHGGGLHVARHLIGVLGHKLSALAAGHGKDALEDGQDGVLVNILPILGNLLGHIVHPVNAAGDVKGKILFGPGLGTANDHHTLLKGLGGGGGDVGLAVIVDGIAVQQAPHGDAGIAGAALGAENLPDVGIARQRSGLPHFIEAGAGDAVHRILESLGVERLGIKLGVRHSSIFLSEN